MGAPRGHRPALPATDRRRDSHAAAAIDLLAAAPLLSATALAQLLGIAIKSAIRLLDGFVVQGLASEVTHRAKRRLYGLIHLAPLRDATAPPPRPWPGRRPGRLGAAVIEPLALLVPAPPLPPHERRQFDFGDIDQLLKRTDQAIRHAQTMLEQHRKPTMPAE